MTLIEVLQAAAGSTYGVRFIDRHEQATWLSYSDLLRQSQSSAATLHNAGVRPGDRVAIILPTGPEFLQALFGALWLGAIPVPLYPPVRLGHLAEYQTRTANMLRVVHAKTVVTNTAIRAVLGAPVVHAARCITLTQATDSAFDTAAPRRDDDVALIQFSSGTTVEPKPVMLTHRQIIANLQAIKDAILAAYPHSDDFRHSVVSWLPLYHDMGLIGTLLTALFGQVDLTLLAPEVFVTQPALWLRTLARYKATISAAPNFAYSLCTERIRDAQLQGVDLSSWRIALNGAEAVTPAALHKFAARFAPFGFRLTAFTPVYGLAEAALAVTFSPLDRPFEVQHFDTHALEARGQAIATAAGRPLVSVGKPLPGYGVRIMRDATQLDANCLGRVHVSGPSLMLGYDNNADATALALRDGWLDTGDLGFMHDGELYLVGRAKDVVILRGRNYAPQDIEQALDAVDGVRLGCSIAASYAPAGADTEALIVFVERRSQDAAPTASDTEALTRAVQQRLGEALGLVARDVVVLAPGTLPRTSSGKLRRRVALERHLNGTLQPPQRVTRWRLVAAMARTSIARHTPHWLRGV